ncbi:hypothetical protein JOC77_004249 [Peribacillus deserti]|uniref:Uncharacterized protein n=1 Tax=Peribacillus deserti TaxID=673318 RepID=A0ABS2QNL7_9BACI|nr:YlzJ-like family protein [Peribacillus deserti]MBM7694772.1 hypothetical protein [Peribacillus deserti]
MIIYTTVPQELIFHNEAEQPPIMMEIDYRGISLQVQCHSPFSFMVERILSTDPDHFLDPEVQPGTILRYSPSEFA